MGRAIFFSLAIIIVSFVPVFLLEVQEGRMFRPLAFTKMFNAGLIAVTAAGFAIQWWSDSPLWLDALVLALIIPFALVGFCNGRHASRAARRYERGLCPACGNCLAGNASGVCPECGMHVFGASP